MLKFEQALQTVKEKLGIPRPALATQTVPLEQALGRVLAEDVLADRDVPPFDRSTRDGYAVRTCDLGALPALLEIAGEARAGQPFLTPLAPGRCVEISTGAPLPPGADAVVMMEHTRVQGSQVEVTQRAESFENVVRQGSEAAVGSPVLRKGRRLGPGEIGLLAAVGMCSATVFSRPRVAILTTGDEVVPVEERPAWFQVRNSNAAILSAQVWKAGGIPHLLGVVHDDRAALRGALVEGLKDELLLVSGGVSVGKHDLVKEILASLGAEFHFHGVAIRPGKPLLFGHVGEKFVFGIPGNPVSTLVTFELFIRPVVSVLAGSDFEPPLFLRACVGTPYFQSTGLTMFVPAEVQIEEGRPTVRRVRWQGSGDLVGMAQANCLMVIRPEQRELAVGDWVDILPVPC